MNYLVNPRAPLDTIYPILVGEVMVDLRQYIIREELGLGVYLFLLPSGNYIRGGLGGEGLAV